jgi:hypothetical protein
MGTLPSIVLRRICDAPVRCAPIGTNEKKRACTDNSQLPRNIRAQLARHRLCWALEESLPLLTTRGSWTINGALASALATELKEFAVPDPVDDFCKLFPSLSATWCLQAGEQALIALYETWATVAAKPAHDNKEARELWDKLVSARKTLAKAILEAYDEDGHVYPLSKEPSKMHLAEPEKLRNFEWQAWCQNGRWSLDEAEARFHQ